MSRWYNEIVKKVEEADVKMNDYERELTDCLADAGFDGDTTSEAVRLYKNGVKNDLMRFLRSKRCDLIDKMHESQKKIDRFDYVIRQTDKM